jgi:phosphoribosylglycinamide formyltransferase-1
MRELHKPGIAILASGSGSTAEAFIHATQEGIVDAEVGLVISDKDDAGVFDRVKRLNKAYSLEIETMIVNAKRYDKGPQERGQTLQESEIMCEAISDGGFALVALMGYMRIIAAKGDLMKEYGWLPEYEERYPENKGIYLARMINTHPGILPETTDTWGTNTQQMVLDLKLSETAHTVHAVTAEIDAGPIFAENRVPVYQDDGVGSLFARVQRIEKAHLPVDIDRFLREQRAFYNSLDDARD